MLGRRPAGPPRTSRSPSPTCVPSQDRLDEIGRRVQHVLAVVQHHQQPPARQRVARCCRSRVRPACGVIPSAVGHRVRHRRRVADRGQLDQPHAVGELGDQLGRDLDREAGLADPADARSTSPTDGPHQLGQLLHLDVAAHEARRLHRQVPWCRLHDAGATAPPRSRDRVTRSLRMVPCRSPRRAACGMPERRAAPRCGVRIRRAHASADHGDGHGTDVPRSAARRPRWLPSTHVPRAGAPRGSRPRRLAARRVSAPPAPPTARRRTPHTRRRARGRALPPTRRRAVPCSPRAAARSCSKRRTSVLSGRSS